MTCKTTDLCRVICFLALICFLFSCRKNQPRCKSNCAEIDIKGRVYIKTTGEAIKDVPVEVNWRSSRFCLICPGYKVASGRSDNNGNFNFTVTIDTSFFENYNLSVKSPINKNMIPEQLTFNEDFLEGRFYDYDPAGWENIHFAYYPKAYLTLRLQRTLSDNFESFGVFHYFNPSYNSSVYSASEAQAVNDTTIIVETAAGVYTKIVSYKKIIPGSPSVEVIDSIICTQNGPNVFDIKF